MTLETNPFAKMDESLSKHNTMKDFFAGHNFWSTFVRSSTCVVIDYDSKSYEVTSLFFIKSSPRDNLKVLQGVLELWLRGVVDRTQEVVEDMLDLQDYSFSGVSVQLEEMRND